MNQLDKIEKNIIRLLRDKIRNIPDFPKPGIQFKDITPLLINPDTLEYTSHILARPYHHTNVDLVMGIESRGFLFGTNLAQDLHAGFIAVRKPNKLPHDTISASYSLEYGEDAVEIHSDSINDGDRVLIHDDLIATGGSAAAAAELVEKLGGVVVGYSFILEIEAIGGREKLTNGVPVESLIVV